MLCTYRWPNGPKLFSIGRSHKGWKEYQGIINNTYHGGNIETDHHVIYLIPEDVEKHFALPNYTTLVPGTLREVIDNENTTRDKIYPYGLEIKS